MRHVVKVKNVLRKTVKIFAFSLPTLYTSQKGGENNG